MEPTPLPPSTVRRLATAAARVAAVLGCALVVAWSAGALRYGPWPGWAGAVLAGAALLALVLVARRWRGRPRPLLVAMGAVFVLGAVAQAVKRPRTDRDWSPDQAVAARAEFDGERVTVRNVRHCHYRSESDYDVRHYDRTYDLGELEAAYFLVETLTASGRVAHTLVSFRFRDGAHLAVSAEVRKERGETFGVLPGLFREFELSYVAADERDVVALRVVHRGNPVRLYPLRATPGQLRGLFVGMLRRMNRLVERPEFYNSLVNTCTTNVADHVNQLAPGAVPFDLRVLLSGNSDALAHELGLLDTDLTLAEARARFLVDPAVARAHATSEDFSEAVRRR
jgi:hypothetical protein